MSGAHQSAFIEPLRQAIKNGEPIISAQAVATLFANVEDLVRLNKEVCVCVRVCVLVRIKRKTIGASCYLSCASAWTLTTGKVARRSALATFLSRSLPFSSCTRSTYPTVRVTYLNNRIRVLRKLLVLVDDKAAQTLVEQTKSNPAFATFLKDLMASPHSQGLSLLSYLIMPVQRIPRYKVLQKKIFFFFFWYT